jgi:hypothetical protein
MDPPGLWRQFQTWQAKNPSRGRKISQRKNGMPCKQVSQRLCGAKSAKLAEFSDRLILSLAGPTDIDERCSASESAARIVSSNPLPNQGSL